MNKFNKKLNEEEVVQRKISRARFLQLSGALAAGGGVLAACNRTPRQTMEGSTSAVTKEKTDTVDTAAAAAGPLLHPVRVSADPTKLPPPLKHRAPITHKVELICKEIIGEIDHGNYFLYLTFNGQVPAPMIRVRQGDTIDLTINNPLGTMHAHSVDFHAVYGTGGGSSATTVGPGQKKRLKFKTLYPGAFIYHCAVANLDYHISSGMFGMIVVEPPEGLPKVDHEFYFGQNEIYVKNQQTPKNKPLQFDYNAMTAENPRYVVLNGESHAITDQNYGAVKVKKGENARIFFVNGGPNLMSSFHPIGNIWTKVWREGAVLNHPERYVQTVGVSPGSCAVLEMEFPVPETIKLVDHALSRVVHKGLLALIEVEGEPEPDIFQPIPG